MEQAKPIQLFFGGRPIASGELSPPLVSLVLINWNYADYVGAAIKSIQRQDYPLFECIVADNASKDDSVAVIKRHIDDDPRFSLVELPENVGQLNAALHVFDRLRGGFVVFADADDALLPNFLSSHLQVHLALPSSVGLTSSDVLQTDSAAQVLTGHRQGFGYDCKAAPAGLKQSSETVRLSTVSESDFQSLAQRVACIDRGENSWVWAPGTANMYRKSILDLILPDPRDRSTHTACDNYFIPFVHFLTGSALIFQPLSLYRFHDRNEFSSSPPIGDLITTKSETLLRTNLHRHEIVRTLMRRATTFKNFLSPPRYWATLDFTATIGGQKRREFFAQPNVQAIILENYRYLVEAFGERTVIAELRRRMPSKHWWRLIRAAYADRLPLSHRIYMIAWPIRRLIGRAFQRG